MTRRAAIIAGCRTPFVRSGTVLKDLTAIELGVLAVRELMDRSGVRGEDVDHLVYGTVVHDPHAPNIAREVGLATLPKTVPAGDRLPGLCHRQSVDRGRSQSHRAWLRRRRRRGRCRIAHAHSDHHQAGSCGKADWRLQGEDARCPPRYAGQDPAQGSRAQLPPDRRAHHGRKHGGVGRAHGQGERHQSGRSRRVGAPLASARRGRDERREAYRGDRSHLRASTFRDRGGPPTMGYGPTPAQRP